MQKECKTCGLYGICFTSVKNVCLKNNYLHWFERSNNLNKYDKKESNYVNSELKKLQEKLRVYGIRANYNQLIRLDNTLISCHVNLSDMNLSDCKTVDEVMDKVRCQ